MEAFATDGQEAELGWFLGHLELSHLWGSVPYTFPLSSGTSKTWWEEEVAQSLELAKFQENSDMWMAGITVFSFFSNGIHRMPKRQMHFFSSKLFLLQMLSISIWETFNISSSSCWSVGGVATYQPPPQNNSPYCCRSCQDPAQTGEKQCVWGGPKLDSKNNRTPHLRPSTLLSSEVCFDEAECKCHCLALLEGWDSRKNFIHDVPPDDSLMFLLTP